MRREDIETFVLEKLSNHIFSDAMMSALVVEYKEYALSVDTRVSVFREQVNSRLAVVNKEIANIVSVIATTGSQALNVRLGELETEKKELAKNLKSIESELGSSNVSEKDIKMAFRKAKKMVAQGTLATNKKIIDKYVDKITMFKDHIEIRFNIGIINPLNPTDDCGDFKITNLLTLNQKRAQI